MHCVQYALKRFMLKFGSAVESIEDYILNSGVAILADLVNDLLCGAEQWPAVQILFAAVVELERQARGDDERTGVPGLAGAKLVQVGQPCFNILY